MATSGSSQSLVRQWANFTNSADGLEKTLRLLQAFAQIFADLAITSASAVQWALAKQHIGLSRRFFRYFKFIDAFGKAWTVAGTSSDAGFVLLTTEVGKWSCLGLYLLLEASTIMDALGVWETTWGGLVFIEAYRFWFFSLSFSMINAMWQIFISSPPENKTRVQKPNKAVRTHADKSDKSEKPKSGKSDTIPSAKDQKDHSALYQSLVADACDLLIPGAIVGWIDVSPATVGMASVVSTLIVGRNIWIRVQKSAAASA